MPENEEQEVTRKSGMVYAAALTLFASVLVCLCIGWALDRWLATSPWLLVAGIVLGAGVGFYEFVRILSKVS
jgi:ATP synthase protein I